MFHVKHSGPNPAEAICSEFAIPIGTAAKLTSFVGLLTHWNQRINLVARNELDHIWDRHVRDSLQLIPLIPSGVDRAIDLGSGAGFPGLVLAIATGIRFDLIESDQRKSAFLREAIRETAAPATVHTARAETLSLPPAPLITVRALAPLPRLLDLIAPFLAPGGVALLPKGAGVRNELTDARRQWHMRVECLPSRTNADAVILRIGDLHRA